MAVGFSFEILRAEGLVHGVMFIGLRVFEGGSMSHTNWSPES